MKKGNMKGTKSGFTLVELIVVITILAILATIGFVSFSGYLAGTRDTNRIAQLKSMSDALELYRTKKDLPIPDDKVDVKSGDEVIAYQGYIGKNVLETIEYTESGLDPKDKQYFSYYLTKNKKYFQLLTFLEEPDTDVIALNNFNKTFAIDYSDRYPKTTGNKLGILTDEFNTPIQELTEITNSGYLDIVTTNIKYNSILKGNDILIGTGTRLHYVKTFASVGGKFCATYNLECMDPIPKISCPIGYIPVGGNPDFPYADGTVKDFCVAQYEMSYDETTSSDSSSDDWNTRAYSGAKIPVSMSGRLPIVDLTQQEAIDQCKKIGAHLITNNEWMTIARNIEGQDDNWSEGIVGKGFIHNGVSDEISNGHGCEGKQDENNRAGPTGSDCNGGKNKLKLFYGNYIYDLSGNIWEHVNKANTIDGNGFHEGHTSATGSYDDDGADNDGVYDSGDMDKYASVNHYGTDKGMGNIWYAIGRDNNIFLRGSAANDGFSTGIFYISMDWIDGIKGTFAGFRCVKEGK